VTARLESDVPLGCFLSGGLDSGLVAAFAQEALRGEGKKLRTFTMRMPKGGYDESEAAGLTAGLLGTDHTTLDPGAAEAGDLVMLIESLGLPAGDSSLLPAYWLSRAAREHVTVALAGDGGDELFGGYLRHVAAPTLANWRMLLRVMGVVPWPDRDPKGRVSKLGRLCRAARGAGYDDLVAIFDQSEMRGLTLGRAACAAFRVPKNVMAHDRDGYLPADLLRKTDTASMAVALELRSPMLASSLVFRASATSRSVLMPRGERKGLLKQLARKHLPAEVVGLPKSGFAIPIGVWFREETGFRSLLNDTLGQSDPFPGLTSEIDLARIGAMRRALEVVGRGRGRDPAQRLYALLALAIWCRWNRSLGGA
jgi:asparagine synthase (glutamine-hydrolysing)